jgi:hypothetical protein
MHLLTRPRTPTASCHGKQCPHGPLRPDAVMKKDVLNHSCNDGRNVGFMPVDIALIKRSEDPRFAASVVTVEGRGNKCKGHCSLTYQFRSSCRYQKTERTWAEHVRFSLPIGFPTGPEAQPSPKL